MSQRVIQKSVTRLFSVRNTAIRRYTTGAAVEGERREYPTTYDVYVTNVNYRTGWMTLKDHMQQVGDVGFVVMLKGPDGRSDGRAIVKFKDEVAAQTAIEKLNQTELDGRTIYVRKWFTREEQEKFRQQQQQQQQHEQEYEEDFEKEE